MPFAVFKIPPLELFGLGGDQMKIFNVLFFIYADMYKIYHFTLLVVDQEYFRL